MTPLATVSPLRALALAAFFAIEALPLLRARPPAQQVAWQDAAGVPCDIAGLWWDSDRRLYIHDCDGNDIEIAHVEGDVLRWSLGGVTP